VSTTPANIFGWHIYNQDATDVFLHVYDLASASVTVGTTTPTLTIAIPGSGIIDTWPSASDRELGMFRGSTAITIAVTTTVGGLTSPTNGCIVNVSYA
jgi:hypothetical protein